MEEKKFDKNSILGFILIGSILIWMLYVQKPAIDENNTLQGTPEQVVTNETQSIENTFTPNELPVQKKNELSLSNTGDSLALDKLKNRLGSFAYSGTLPSATDATTVIENEVLRLTISNKGGYITEAKLKEHTMYTADNVYLIKDNNASLNLEFSAENRLLNTKDLYFEPALSTDGDNHV